MPRTSRRGDRRPRGACSALQSWARTRAAGPTRPPRRERMGAAGDGAGTTGFSALGALGFSGSGAHASSVSGAFATGSVAGGGAGTTTGLADAGSVGTGGGAGAEDREASGVGVSPAPSRWGKWISGSSIFQSFQVSVTTGRRCGRPWKTWSKTARLMSLPACVESRRERTWSKRSRIRSRASSSGVPAAMA